MNYFWLGKCIRDILVLISFLLASSFSDHMSYNPEKNENEMFYFDFQGAPASRRSDGDPKLVGTGKGLKAILGGLEELWDHSQYAEEYNLNQFLTKLNG